MTLTITPCNAMQVPMTKAKHGELHHPMRYHACGTCLIPCAIQYHTPLVTTSTANYHDHQQVNYFCSPSCHATPTPNSPTAHWRKWRTCNCINVYLQNVWVRSYMLHTTGSARCNKPLMYHCHVVMRRVSETQRLGASGYVFRVCLWPLKVHEAVK